MQAIDDYINGNLTDAKRRAKKSGRKKVFTELRAQYGKTKHEAEYICDYLFGEVTWQEHCDLLQMLKHDEADESHADNADRDHAAKAGKSGHMCGSKLKAPCPGCGHDVAGVRGQRNTCNECSISLRRADTGEWYFQPHAIPPAKAGERSEQVTCLKCGWHFTVEGIPYTPVYNAAKWFCPHCGSSPEGPAQLVIFIEGGTVREVISDMPVEVLQLDFDVEGACAGDYHKVPEWEGMSEAFVRYEDATVNGEIAAKHIAAAKKILADK